MLNIAPALAAWCRADRPFAVATVIDATGSTPLPVGTSMAVDADGRAAGSVSGGCVDAAVHELCRRQLEEDATPEEAQFDSSDTDAWAAGLMCGGGIRVHVQRVHPADRHPLAATLSAAAEGRTVGLLQITRSADPTLAGRVLPLSDDGTPAPAGPVPPRLAALAAGVHRTGVTGLVRTAGDADCSAAEALVHTRRPAPRMLVFGAVEFAGALTQAGRFLGYHVTLCDARPVFATAERFPHAHRVVTDWPHRFLAATATDERTVVCVLTHDPRFDVPLLREALRRPLGYVGAMGSRRTHARRLELLRAEGVGPDALARLNAPIGLDLGAATPQETAVSIVAEILARTRGRSGAPLGGTTGPIHPRAGEVAHSAQR
ncbi:XdhC/CoxI family protein [Streptomyces sp. NPDC051987]|uniref:XdhC family protein n=1 Tax=Streptomyces sp. NPDC051987 TaxID=3155808 RepID=UPI00342E928B